MTSYNESLKNCIADAVGTILANPEVIGREQAIDAVYKAVKAASGTIDSVVAELPTRDALAVLRQTADKYDYVQLIPDTSGEASANSLTLDVWIDGEGTGHTVTLDSTGTWRMKTIVEI